MFHERVTLESQPKPEISIAQPEVERKESRSAPPPQAVGDNFVRLNLKRRLNVKHHIHPKHAKPSTQSENREEYKSAQQIQEQSGTGPGMLEEEVISLYTQTKMSSNTTQTKMSNTTQTKISNTTQTSTNKETLPHEQANSKSRTVDGSVFTLVDH